MIKIRRDLPNDKYLAAILANSPSSTNVFATMADLVGLGGGTATSVSRVQHAVKYGQQINIGQAIYVSSADGTNMIVSKADNSTESTSTKSLGLAIETGNINHQGAVITEGLLAGFNTSAAIAGDPVWLGTNGNLLFGLANKPLAPSRMVFIGIVTISNINNGEIFVKVQNGFEIDDLHDVSAATRANNTLLGYNSSTLLHEFKTITTWLGYTPVTDVRTISTSGPLSGGGDLSSNRTLSITQSSTSSDGYLSSTDWNIFNTKLSATRSISTTGPLAGGGDLSANRTFSILQATNTSDGYLSQADWTIFNTKQAALGFTPVSKAGDTLTGNIFATNLSGTNTGDESTASVKAKLGAATSTLDGYLTFGDWVIFNAKQNAIGYTPANKAGETFTGSISATNLSGTNTGNETTASIKSTLGIATSTVDGYLVATDWVIFNSKVSTTRTISTTAPLSGGGDLSGNLTLSIPQASATVNGYLTSTDWSTFSGKQNALGFTPQAQITLTTAGYEGVATLSGSTLNIPTYKSILYTGTFAGGDGYNAGDVVLYNNSLYYCILTIGSASVPTSDPTHWSLFLPGSGTITLTTTGTSGAATLSGGTLNIPQYTGGATTNVFELKPNYVYRGITINNNSTTVTAEGGVVMSSSASNTAQSVASTNFATKQIRLRYYATSVTGGRYSGTRGSALLWYIQGGFHYVCDFNISDTAFAAGCQQFYGMAGQTTDLSYGTSTPILVSTLINIVGVGNEVGDTNLQVFHNDATGTASKIDLGIDFPANRTSGAISTTFYSVHLYNTPSSTDVHYKVTNNETGVVATGVVSTNLPLSSQGLNFFASRSMAATSVTSTGQSDLSKLGVYSIL